MNAKDTTREYVGWTWKGLIFLILIGSTASAAELHVRVTNESNRPIWTRLEVRGPDGKMYQPPDGLRDTTATNRPGGGPYYLGSFVAQGESTIRLPVGRYTVVAEHGLEYERSENTVEVSEEAPTVLNLQLRRWVHLSDLGWWSGDMHIHRSPQDSSALALAEDVNVNVVFTMWNRRIVWDVNTLGSGPVIQVSPDHLVTLMNAEDERGGGAWMLNRIHKPVPSGMDARWFPPGITLVEEVRAQRSAGDVLPWFDSEKPIWWEVPVMMALATPDSLGVLHNHFNQYGICDTEGSGRPRDQEQFPGWKGFVDYSLGLYYRYLNLGFRVSASAGSASGVLPNPVGYNRVYVQVPGPLSIEKWYRALRDGNSFVTNGPILFFSAKRVGSRIKACFEARAREPIDRVEIIANGLVIQHFRPETDSRYFKGDLSFDSKNHSWVAARCFLKSDSSIRLAHSSPVYLDGKWDHRADAQYFVNWMDELIAQTTTDEKRFASDAERDQLLALYRRARAFYADRAR